MFRTFDGTVYAVDNQDPSTGVFVLSRGIVRSRGDAPNVLSPLQNQAFDLRTGVCLDDPAVPVAVHPVELREGTVFVAEPAVGPA